ncbi:MAG: S1C family serine protease, partial [Alphaproteobacteria bacterium]
EALLKQGYDVVSDIGKIYVPKENLYRSELEFAASIIDLKMNLCHLYNGLVFMSMNQAGGSAYVKVKWEIYDPLRRKSLGTIITEGNGYVDVPVEGGVDNLILNAVREAAVNLGHSQAFYNMVTGKQSDKDEEKLSAMEITSDMRPYNKPLKENFSFIRRAVLTVRTANGHGSGFYINNEGYALTNYHVVGEAKTVAVTDFSGTSHMAKVVRVHKMRDVALLKVDVFDNPVMALQLKHSPNELDRVYSLGTPLTEKLKVTVTEGIISTFRLPRKTGLSLIQASVPLAEGNSGGPLLDENGNVIAIAVSGIGNKSGTVYSHFIPIQDALRKLNIKMVKPAY